MLCSPETIDFYRRMIKPFLALANGSQPSNRLVREFLSAVAQRDGPEPEACVESH